jgi:hypothetical protein
VRREGTLNNKLKKKCLGSLGGNKYLTNQNSSNHPFKKGRKVGFSPFYLLLCLFVRFFSLK